jgi:hypothetical protein
VEFGIFAHGLTWLLVAVKIQRKLCAGKGGRNFVRENAEAKTKTSGRAGIWTQLDMNILSFSWKLPVDWWAP